MRTFREKLHQRAYSSQGFPLVSLHFCAGPVQWDCCTRKLSIMANRTRTYGRGILRFTSLEPCRRPGQTVASNGVVKREEAVDNSRVQNGGKTHVLKTQGTADDLLIQAFKIFILLTDFLTFLLNVCSEKLVLNQERILLLIIFFILLACLLDNLLIW